MNKTKQPSARDYEAITARLDSPAGGLAAIRARNGWTPPAEPVHVPRQPARARRHRTLTDELDYLERADPAVRAASRALDETTQRATSRQEPTMTQPPALLSNTELLARARQITTRPPISAAVKRVDAAIDRLRDVMTDHESKAVARREIERLEAQLAQARAKLRGGVSVKAPRAVEDQQLECRKGCGRTSPNPQGRAAHERFCTRSDA